MTAFDRAVEHVLEVEGGLVEHPEDPGGLTNMGISLAAFPSLGRDGILNLTPEEARALYLEHYWAPIAARAEDDRLRFAVFDAAVNHGPDRALRWLRDNPTLLTFTAYRLRFYARLTTFTTFGRGWINRMAKVTNVLADLPNPLLPVERLFIRQADGTFDSYQLDPERPARIVGDKIYANLPRR